MPYYIKRTKAKKKDKPLPLFDKAGVTVKKKPDLKAKLDKEFSLFIRLRDCMPNGYFRCISCGQIKPFTQADCGHYFSRTHLATRFDEYKEPVSDFPSDSNQNFAKEMEHIFR